MISACISRVARQIRTLFDIGLLNSGRVSKLGAQLDDLSARRRAEDLADRLNPVLHGAVGSVDLVRGRGRDGGSDTSAAVVAHNDDVVHAELSDGVRQHRLAAGRRLARN